MSTFSGLSTALSSLVAQRRGLDVTGQNVANANTEGYSRQRVSMSSSTTGQTAAIWSTPLPVGTGVTVSDVDRIRDVFLERRAHTEHGRQELLGVRRAVLAEIEQTFGEPSDTGLQSQLSDFWAAWGDVSNRPGDLAARAQLVQRTHTLVEGFRRTDAALSAQWASRREQLAVTVEAVNTAARQVAELNAAIRHAEQVGQPNNDLTDKRDLLVVQLADLAGITARSGDDGSVDVYLGGAALVRGDRAEQLQVSGAAGIDGAGAEPVRITWARDGYDAEVTGGRAGGLHEVLTGTIPGTVARLDAVVGTLVTAVNDAHAAGKDLDGLPGGPVFAGTSARTLVAALEDPRRVAAGGAASADGSLDGSNADALAGIARLPKGPDYAYRQLIVGIGVESQTAQRRTDVQTEVTRTVDGLRDAAAGVNMDEEMVNMLAYQRAYEAAARLMSAVDSTLDTLINRTGLVGR